jgi:hypothetical protein
MNNKNIWKILVLIVLSFTASSLTLKGQTTLPFVSGIKTQNDTIIKQILWDIAQAMPDEMVGNPWKREGAIYDPIVAHVKPSVLMEILRNKASENGYSDVFVFISKLERVGVKDLPEGSLVQNTAIQNGNILEGNYKSLELIKTYEWYGIKDIDVSTETLFVKDLVIKVKGGIFDNCMNLANIKFPKPSPETKRNSTVTPKTPKVVEPEIFEETVATTKCGKTVTLTSIDGDGITELYNYGTYAKKDGVWYKKNGAGYDAETCESINTSFVINERKKDIISCCTTNYVKPVVNTAPQQKVITLYCGDKKPRDLQIIGLDTCYTTYNIGCGSPKVFSTIYEIGVAYNDNGQPAFFRKMLNGREEYKIYSNGKWVDYCNETNKHNPTVPPSYVKKNNQWVKTAAIIAGAALVAYLVTKNGQRQVYNPPSGGSWTPVSTDSNGNVVSTDNAGNFISTDQNGNIISADQL